MRHVGLSIVATAMLFASATAQAGLRAVFVDVRDAKQLQIDVHDNGDARISEAGSEDYGLLIGGDFYIVDIEKGKATVARLKDVANAIDQVLPPIFKGLFDNPGEARPKAPLNIEIGDEGEAGGRKGRIFRVRGLDQTQPDKPTDYLISADADLKPVGAALEQFMNAAVVPAAPLIGTGAIQLVTETRAIFSLGTPIDVGGRFRLNLAGKAAFPSAYFRLPAQPQTVPQLVAAMKSSMEEAAATPSQK